MGWGICRFTAILFVLCSLSAGVDSRAQVPSDKTLPSLDALMGSFDEIQRGSARDLGLFPSKETLKSLETVWNVYADNKRGGIVELPEVLNISLQRHSFALSKENLARVEQRRPGISWEEKKSYHTKAIEYRTMRLLAAKDFIEDLEHKFFWRLDQNSRVCGKVFSN